MGGKKVVLSLVVFNAEHMLSLHEVSCASFPVQATHKEPSARSAAVFPRDKRKRQRALASVGVDRLYVDEPIDAWHPEWSVLYVL